MACLDQLQADVAAILAIMELPPSCCEGGDITDGDRYTDRVTDGVGDVPQNIIDAGYASGVSDWAGFDDYKCMISHVIADQLNARLLELAPYITGYGLLIGGIAIVTTIVTSLFTGGLTAIAYGLIAATGTTALLYQGLISGDWATLLAGRVVSNHDELACAVYNSDGDEGALVALNDKIDELFTLPEAIVLKNMNLGPTLKALYAGRYDQQDMADILLNAGYELTDFTCDCDQYGEYRWITDFNDETYQGWQNANITLSEDGIGGTFCVKLGMGSIQNQLYIGMDELLDELGITAGAGDVLHLNRVKFNYMFNPEGEFRGLVLRLRCEHDGGTEDNNHLYVDEFTEVEHVFDPPLEITFDEEKVVLFYPSTVGSLTWAYIDNITVDVDYTAA